MEVRVNASCCASEPAGAGSFLGTLIVTLLVVLGALALAPAGRAAELYGSITIDGPAVPVTIGSPGDNETLSFNSPQQDERIFLQISNGSVGSTFSIRDSGGHTLASQFINRSGIFDTMKLGAPGPYSIYIDPSGTNTGSVTLTLYSVPDDVPGTIYANAQPVPVTIPHVGQGARIDFWGADQERVFLNVSNGSVGSTFTFRDQNGNPLTNPLASQFINRSGIFDTRRLTYTGHYSITIDPAGTNTGTVTLTLYAVPEDIADTIRADGQPKPVTIPNVGQNASYSFPASTDERVFLKVTNGSVGSTFAIKQGDTSLASSFINTSNNIGPVTFDQGDTASVSVDPSGLNTGSVTLTLYEVPPDFRGTITPGGPAVPVTTTTPGQNAYLTFTGASAAQSVRVLAANSSIALWDVSLLNPNQSVRASATSRGLGSFTALNWVTVPGVAPPDNSYTIKIDPRDDKYGEVAIALDGSPAVMTAPGITGLANEEEQLTPSPGDWTGNAVAFSFQWMRCDSLGASCADIDGGQGTAYTPVEADFGKTLRVRVQGTNPYGSASAVSRQTPLVLAPINQLGLIYRPWLLFNRGDEAGRFERWRPLAIDSFLKENAPLNEICYHPDGDYAVGFCGALYGEGGSSGLFSQNGDDSYIDIAGDGEDDYHAPATATCSLAGGLQDCNDGPSSAIYYEPGQDFAEYRYLDYWWFLRDNDVPGDHHEGDWEGTTVVLDPVGNVSAPAAVAFVIAAHEARPWYLAGDVEPAGSHPLIYSAEGGHASYSTPCPSLAEPTCLTPDYLPEQPHDGLSAWLNNSDTYCDGICARRFPPTGWPYWLGRWGASVDEAIEAPVNWSPQSPSRQARFKCADSGYTGANCQRFPGARTPTALTNSAAAPALCRRWLAADVAALACDARQLRRTIRNHLLTRHGQLHLTAAGHRSSDVPGLAQVVGSPLRPGNSVIVTGRASARTTIVLQIANRGHFYRTTFPFSRLRHRKRTVLRIRPSSTGPPAIAANGRLLQTSFVRLR